MFFVELSSTVIYQTIIEIFSSQMRISSSSFNLEYSIIDRE